MVVSLMLFINSGIGVLWQSGWVRADGLPTPLPAQQGIQIVKIQARTNGIINDAAQLVVVKNLGPNNVNLSNYRLDYWFNGQLKLDLSKTLSDGLMVQELLPGQELVIVGHKDRARDYLQDDDLMLCLKKTCKTGDWLKTSGLLRLVNSQTGLTESQVEYKFHKADKMDVYSQTVDETGRLQDWKYYPALDGNKIWLKARQLPLNRSITEPPQASEPDPIAPPAPNPPSVEPTTPTVNEPPTPSVSVAPSPTNPVMPITQPLQSSQLSQPSIPPIANHQPSQSEVPTTQSPQHGQTPSCRPTQDLIDGHCLNKCRSSYQRDLVTKQCRRICPAGKILDAQTDQCVIDPASCGDGSVYNPVTKRCNKKAVVEPKTCPAGSVLNPQTRRCVKTMPSLEPRTCPAGYYLNLTTNRCNKSPLPLEPKSCPVGYFLNLATNRCNKIALAVAKPPCPEGQLRHPETGRCRKIVLEADCQVDQELVGQKCLKKCPEGQLRHPTTHRCQKVIEACPAGFERDVSGVCVKRNQVATAQQLETLAHQPVKNYQFDWLKLFNSPIGGALAASVVFVIYDKFFRAKN